MNPLAKKLLIKPGQQWLVLNSPEDFLATLEPLPEGLQLVFSAHAPVAGMLLFVKNTTELALTLAEVKSTLKPDTILWSIYPKKNSGITSDLEMMSGWDVATEFGLRSVASAAVNDKWTALRLRPESLVKHSDFSREAIKNNDHSAYIDVTNKRIMLPPDVAVALSAAPAAMETYDKLAWSHRKEYMVWVLSAKQEQTRTTRINKMVAMLLAGKKNPSEK